MRSPVPWLVVALGAALLGPALLAPADASPRPGLKIYVGYMDTHTKAWSRRQPDPWPLHRPLSFVGSPCPHFGTSHFCWDAAAVRIDNRTGRPVRVHVTVVVGKHVYDLWGRHRIKAGQRLVLTETGQRNSENFDLSDFAPNDYAGGNQASCVSSGAIPKIRVRVGRATRVYRDRSQVLNTGGVDAGHCVDGHFVEDRRDESHPWTLVRRYSRR